MNTYLDCLPCFLSQALRAARLISSNADVHEQILRNVLRKSADMPLNQPPPAMGRWIYRMVREISGNRDPYKAVKEEFNAVALDLYPDVKQMILGSGNPFETAARLAIAGNIIDFGVNGDIHTTDIRDILHRSLNHELSGNILEFEKAVRTANHILYLGDNAGEIVFDRLFIEEMQRDKITYAVRGGPVINDVTMEDARATGITNMVRVIDNGSDAPGTLLDQCSEKFQEEFAAADLIIAKGQGNYESLSDSDKNIFFIFMVKCPVVAAHTGLAEGSRVIFNKAS